MHGHGTCSGVFTGTGVQRDHKCLSELNWDLNTFLPAGITTWSRGPRGKGQRHIKNKYKMAGNPGRKLCSLMRRALDHRDLGTEEQRPSHDAGKLLPWGYREEKKQVWEGFSLHTHRSSTRSRSSQKRRVMPLFSGKARVPTEVHFSSMSAWVRIKKRNCVTL